MRLSKWLAPLVFAVPAAGCTITGLTLATPPHVTVSNAAGVPKGGAREVVLKEPFVDERAIVMRCGMKKNAFGGDTADILCAEPPHVWIARLLKEELVAAGYRVTPADQPGGPAAIRIDGLLRQFFVEPKMGLFSFVPETDVEILLRATGASGLVAERNFYWKGLAPKGIPEADARFKASMESAVKQALGAMVEAISKLLDDYQRTAGVLPTGLVATRVSR